MTPKRYLLSTSAAKLFFTASARHEVDNSNQPLMLHRSGRVCWAATDYLLYLRTKRRLTPGTVRTYADKLAPFISFCDSRNLALDEVTDPTFCDFRDQLLSVPDRPSNNEINSLLRRALYLLLWLQHSGHFAHRVIAFDDASAQVTVYKKFVTYKSVIRKQSKIAIDHQSLLPPNAPETRHPIAEVTIDALWDAIPLLTNDTYRKERLELALSGLEALGCRREELMRIRVSAVQKALKTGASQLEIPDKKKKGQPDKTRLVPVSNEFLKRANAFIVGDLVSINACAKNSGHIKVDSDFLFVTETGKPWALRSLNAEFSELRRLAEIADPAHPHLFRHRRLTIGAHTMSGGEGTTLDRSLVAIKLGSISGNTNPESDAHYVDTAYTETTIWTESDASLKAREDAVLIYRQLRSGLQELRRSKTLDDAKSASDKLIAFLETLRA